MRPGESIIDGMACVVNLAHEVVRDIPVGIPPRESRSPRPRCPACAPGGSAAPANGPGGAGAW